ncbi:MAG: Acetoin utilization protein AcuC [Syntrophorhabdus sp. PtaU1.Bin058]|nr:MAG: Acetoin utilization protein AcuC [Syntrophorhabdus sp. PtaU1.Bin058]
MLINALLYSYDLTQHEYRPSHPFKPARARLMYELLNRYGLISEENQRIIAPPLMNEELLYLFHTRGYIELLKKGEKGEFSVEMLHAGLGTEDNPLFKTMYQYAIAASSGTYEGAMMLYRENARFAFNPFGGFHHAGRDRAEGFCYLNDIAVTITDLIKKGQRVAYVDIDAHHGNGVQDAFYETDRVLNISLHESGETLYPGTGFEVETGTKEGAGYNVNIPLRAGTDDEVYLFAFESLVPPLIKSFKPDVVVANIGCDTHRDDPLAHLSLTSNGYKKVISIINDLSPKILALGAGGYNLFRTAALWTLAWAAFCGLQPHDLHAGIVGGMMYGPEINAGQLDDPPFVVEGREKEQCLAHARRVIDFVKDNIFPVHGITS